MMFTLETVAELLAGYTHEAVPVDERSAAAVAMIFREGGEELELLLIQRSVDERDPWSGNLAFPGGRVMAD